MTLAKLIRLVNKQLADELLSYVDLKDFIDMAIDNINCKLNTKFPELPEIADMTTDEYTAIPDNYLRIVVVPGAAFKFYTTDEEGAAVAPKYEEEFNKGLFYMERDFLMNVPVEYRCLDGDLNVNQGNVIFSYEDGGLSIDGGNFRL